MAKKITVGSRSHQAMVFVWLATTSALLVILSVFGLPTASARNGEVPVFATEYPSVNYAGTYWSLAEVRHTKSSERPCSLEGSIFCNPVVVVESIVSNTSEVDSVISIKDISLAMPSGASHTAKRFDCTSSTLTQDLGSMYRELNTQCPDRGDGIIVKPGESRMVAVLFVPRAESLPSLKQMSFQVREAQRSETLPGLVPLAGPHAPSVYPVEGLVDLTDSRLVLAHPDDEQSEEIVVRPLAAEIDVNYKNTRVVDGKRLALIEVSVRPASLGEGSAFVATQYWNLVAEDQVIEPDWVEKTSSRNSLTLQFSFEPGPTEFDLVAGAQFEEDSEKRTSFKLNFGEYE